MKMVVNDSERTWASYMPLAYFGFFWLQPIVQKLQHGTDQKAATYIIRGISRHLG